jgi:hypothetical protein
MADEQKHDEKKPDEKKLAAERAQALNPPPPADPVGERNYALSEPAVRPEGVGTPGAMRNVAPNVPVVPTVPGVPTVPPNVPVKPIVPVTPPSTPPRVAKATDDDEDDHSHKKTGLPKK